MPSQAPHISSNSKPCVQNLKCVCKCTLQPHVLFISSQHRYPPVTAVFEPARAPFWVNFSSEGAGGGGAGPASGAGRGRGARGPTRGRRLRAAVGGGARRARAALGRAEGPRVPSRPRPARPCPPRLPTAPPGRGGLAPARPGCPAAVRALSQGVPGRRVPAASPPRPGRGQVKAVCREQLCWRGREGLTPGGRHGQGVRYPASGSLVPTLLPRQSVLSAIFFSAFGVFF